MPSIIDVSSDCGSRAAALAAAGVRTVIRYYSRDTIRPSKPLRLDEAGKLAAAGLRIGIVYEGRFGNRADNFDRQTGIADGAFARTYGSATIGQPAGTAIYFGIDFDASPHELNDRIIPYFQGIADAFAQPTGEPGYVIGVYGSGATCAAVLNSGLAERAWLAQAVGWRDHGAFLASNRWTLNQAMPETIAGVECDPNDAGDGMPVGDFVWGGTSTAAGTSPGPIPNPSSATGSAVGHPMRINARSGLRLRSGPGTDFDSIRTLAFGTQVFTMRKSGSWTQVDLQGDGAADGYVSGAFLEEAGSGGTAAPTAGAAAGLSAADSVHVAELIRQGSTAAGLQAARVTATAALAAAGCPPYPTNGCGGHLSALLQQAGIDVKMTLGAGKLASRLADRGWTRIKVGDQKSGDVGVCFDNDPTPAGADHIYLVINAIGPDQMDIADNQNGATNAPHTRYASGRGGKTPTEYFLRAV